MIASCEGEGERNGKAYFKPRLYLTRTRLRNGRERYLVSGSYRAWHEFARHLHKDDELFYAIPNVLEKALFFVNEHVAGILTDVLPHFGEKAKEVLLAWAAENNVIREITGFEELTAKERMVHEWFSVLLTCDIETACELMQLRDVSFLRGHVLESETAVINPGFFDDKLIKRKESTPPVLAPFMVWGEACKAAEGYYEELEKLGVPKSRARLVLPRCTKTTLVMTANLEEWRHAFEQKPTLVPLSEEVEERWPFAYGDVERKWFAK